MWDHTTDDAVEHAAGSTEVKGATVWVYEAALAQVAKVAQLVAEKVSRDVQLFGADNYNLLSAKKLLGNNGRQTTDQMSLTVNDNNLERKVQGV